MRVFSELFNERLKESELFFKKDDIRGAYLIGAFSQSIINRSYKKNNDTFKRWLSGRVIDSGNLKRIYNKAKEYEFKLKIGSYILKDIDDTILAHYQGVDLGEKSGRDEIAYAFRKGLSDYSYFNTIKIPDGSNLKR